MAMMTLLGYLSGFFLGFVGYVFLGNINLTVVQISLSETRKRVQLFILFVAMMEFLYCYGSLWGLELLLKQAHLVAVLDWSAVCIFLALGLYGILHEGRQNPDPAGFSHLRKGVLISIFNPLQVPLWLVCGVYVMQNGLLKSEASAIAIFSFFCSLGTIAILDRKSTRLNSSH